jgi:hypothetical protein
MEDEKARQKEARKRLVEKKRQRHVHQPGLYQYEAASTSRLCSAGLGLGSL